MWTCSGMPGALVVPFVLGLYFNVAEIQVLLRQALIRALCATGGGLASPEPSVGAAKVLLRQALTRALRAYSSFLTLLDAEKNRRYRLRYCSTYSLLRSSCSRGHERPQHLLSPTQLLLPYSSTSLQLPLALMTLMTTMTRAN